MAAGSMVNVTRVRPTDRYFRRCNSIPYRYSAVGIATTVIECPRISLSYIPTPVEELLVKRKKWEKKKKNTVYSFRLYRSDWSTRSSDRFTYSTSSIRSSHLFDYDGLNLLTSLKWLYRSSFSYLSDHYCLVPLISLVFRRWAFDRDCLIPL